MLSSPTPRTCQIRTKSVTPVAGPVVDPINEPSTLKPEEAPQTISPRTTQHEVEAVIVVDIMGIEEVVAEAEVEAEAAEIKVVVIRNSIMAIMPSSTRIAC
jgi:hypothetical protein